MDTMPAPQKRAKVEGEPPTQLEREYILEKIRQLEDQFHPLDFREVTTNQHYFDRFWFHAYYMPGDQITDCFTKIRDSLKWREEFGARSVCEDDVDPHDKKSGAMYSHNKDKDGCKLLVFCVRKHVRDSSKNQSRKNMLVYYLERLQEEEGGKQVTIMFDCEGGGMKNMDLDLVQFLVQVMVSYYPNFVNYIIVYEMPWVLNAGWKIIKSLLPGPAVKKIKFVTKESLAEYVDLDNQLIGWGGRDPWEYTWEPQVRKLPLDGNTVDDKTLMVVDPFQFLEFSHGTGVDAKEAKLEIRNICSDTIIFKVKTTSPELFRVQPHTGFIPPNQTKTVSVHVSTHQSLENEKFQILSTKAREGISSVRESFRVGEVYEEVRLYCTSPSLWRPPAGQELHTPEMSTVLRKVSELEMRMESCGSSIHLQNLLQYILIIINLTILYAVYTKIFIVKF